LFSLSSTLAGSSNEKDGGNTSENGQEDKANHKTNHQPYV
jgi:hypothetical protein